MIESWRDLVVIVAAFAAIAWVLTAAMTCEREGSRDRHLRQLECIKQHVYCGEVQR